ncbi:MAG: hypothetical protein JNJ82_05305 [Opitutaceae bacterium]|nr:hypothetical protein [Opitutaceae bacterium]
MSSSGIARDCCAQSEDVDGVVRAWNSLRETADALESKAQRAESRGRQIKAAWYRERASQTRAVAGESPGEYFRTRLQAIAELEAKAARASASGNPADAAHFAKCAEDARAEACGFNAVKARGAYARTAARVNISLNSGTVALLERLGVPESAWAPALSVLVEEALCAVEDSGKGIAPCGRGTRILHRLTAGPEVYLGTRRMEHQDRSMREDLALQFLFAQVEFGEAPSPDSK